VDSPSHPAASGLASSALVRKAAVAERISLDQLELLTTWVLKMLEPA